MDALPGRLERGSVEQATIAREVVCEGVGLHTGSKVRVRLVPARSGGRVFRTVGNEVVPADLAHVESGARATVLASSPGRPGEPPVRLSTVEHLLAALAASAIDHVVIEVDGPEPPAFDGSAAPWVERLRAAGRRVLGRPLRPIELERSVEVREGDRVLRAEPADAFGIHYEIDFEHPRIGRQVLDLPALDAEGFARELAPARTFAFLEEVESLRAAGLARGGSLDNTVVLDDAGVLNPEGLRFPDEFVRHKAIDLVGDLALLGAPLRAHVHVVRGGHRLHHALARAIAEAGATRQAE